MASCRSFHALRFLPRIAQQICRMVGHDQFGPHAIMQLSAQHGQGRFRAQQIGSSGRSQRDDQLGAHDADLLKKKLRAGVRLDRFRARDSSGGLHFTMFAI